MDESPAVLDPVLTPREVAAWARKSVNAIHREIREGRLRAYRVGQVSVLITKQAAIEWLERTSAQIPAPCRNPLLHGKRPTGRPPRKTRARRRGGAR